jgi:hypothetical protein
VSSSLDFLHDISLTHVVSRQDHAAHGAKGSEGGGMSSAGGGMGLGGLDIANPAVSGIISSIMYYGAVMLPKMSLNKTVELQPTSGVSGAKRAKFFYGPLDLASKQVCHELDLLGFWVSNDLTHLTGETEKSEQNWFGPARKFLVYTSYWIPWGHLGLICQSRSCQSGQFCSQCVLRRLQSPCRYGRRPQNSSRICCMSGS